MFLWTKHKKSGSVAPYTVVSPCFTGPGQEGPPHGQLLPAHWQVEASAFRSKKLLSQQMNCEGRRRLGAEQNWSERAMQGQLWVLRAWDSFGLWKIPPT